MRFKSLKTTSNQLPAPSPVDAPAPASSEKLSQPTPPPTQSRPAPFSGPSRPTGGQVFQWMLLASLGLHAVLLWMPISSKPTVSPQAPPKTVRVVQLPKQQPRPRQTRTQSKSASKARSRSTVPATTLPTIPPPLPSQESSTPESSSPPAAQSDSWDDFPHYPQATTGCFGLTACYQVNDASLKQVSAFFATTLPQKKYQAQLTINEPNRQVYQVRKGSAAGGQFLTVLTQDNQGTIYVLSNAPLQLSDLAQAEEVPIEVISVLNDLGSMDADPSTFAQPDAYYQPDGTIRPQILTTQLLMDQPFDQLMDTNLRSNLQALKFQVSDALGSYGGGAVHRLQKDSLTLYVNLIPTQDGSGTLIIFWKSLPTSS